MRVKLVDFGVEWRVAKDFLHLIVQMLAWQGLSTVALVEMSRLPVTSF